MRISKNKHKLPSLKRQSFLITFVILLSLLIAASASLKITLDYARSSHSEEERQFYSQLNSKLSTKLMSIKTLMSAFSTQNDLQKALHTQKLYRTSDDWDNMQKQMLRFSLLETGIDSVVCEDMNGNIYQYYYYQDIDGFEKAREYAFSHDGYSEAFQLGGQTLITISAPIDLIHSSHYSEDNLSPNKTKIGQCIFFIDIDVLIEDIGWADLDAKRQVFLLDPNGAILWNSSAATQDTIARVKDVFTSRSNGQSSIFYLNKSYQLFDQRVEDPGWTLIGFSSEPFWQGNMMRLIMGIMISWCICLVLIFLYSIFLINNITGFITFLQNSMRRVDGNAEYRMSYWKKLEFSIVADKFNEMLQRIRDLTKRNMDIRERLYEHELDKKELALVALQSQVNPHFLYNTLECMKSIGVCYGADEIRIICESLAALMRYSIGSSHVSTVKQELDSVACYLSIQNIRFADRFTLTQTVPDSLMDREILRMLLQPLVENAIIHGFSRRSGQGNIELVISEESDQSLLIVLKDDGCGMAVDALDAVRDALADGKSNSIGLANVSQRIKMYYGQSSSLHIESNPGKGTQVRIRLQRSEDSHV